MARKVKPMQIVCVESPEALGSNQVDIVVLPEWATWEKIKDVEQRCPDAVIAGAVVEHETALRDTEAILRCRAVVWHQKENQVDYLKMGTDGTTVGVDQPPAELPIYHFGDLLLGVVVCKDIQLPNPVTDALRSSEAAKKLLCVPAAMSVSSDWNFDNLYQWPTYRDIHVIVSNRSDLGEPGLVPMKSFIGNPACCRRGKRNIGDAAYRGNSRGGLISLVGQKHR
jgi:hypothetical protein